ncbi:hypothetical protein DFJ74DRAFT_424163 [Hyaloraphidium curvatum]|nr:hypothetical protein DFJ74DRAFT_424163 [Hyaloraphidium curvatum]
MSSDARGTSLFTDDARVAGPGSAERVSGVFERVAALSAANPGAVAVRFPGTRNGPRARDLSYLELVEAVNRLVESLKEGGVSEGSQVHVFLSPGIDVVVLILAIWEAGATYVPLPMDSRSYAVSILKASQGFVISDGGGADSVRAAGLTLDLKTMSDTGLLLGTLSGGQVAVATDERIAYVIRTSGTTSRTGFGTAVRVPHSSFLTNLWSIRDRLFSPGGAAMTPIIPLVSPLTFDPSLVELFLPLVLGGTVVILPREDLIAPDRLFPHLARCTAIFCTPSLFRRLSHEHRAEILAGATDVRMFVLGGEPFPQQLFGSHAVDVYNIYGTTECSVWATIWKVEPSEEALLGDPLGPTELELQPIEVEGRDGEQLFELYLGGQARITYVDGDPAGQPPLLRPTGDVVRKVRGGLAYVGRRDGDAQVKIEGRRIDLSQVSHAIRELGVDCEVVDLHVNGSSELAAFLLPPRMNEVAALHRSLALKLPAHALPSSYFLLEELPATANGKVDHTELRKLAKSLEPVLPLPALHVQSWSLPDVLRSLISLYGSMLQKQGYADQHPLGNIYFLAEGGDSLSASFLVEQVLRAPGSRQEQRSLERQKLLDKVLHGTAADVARLVIDLRTELSGNGESIEVHEPSESAPRSSAEASAANSIIGKRKRIEYVVVLERASARAADAQASTSLSSVAAWIELWDLDLKACVDASPLVVRQGSSGTIFIGSHAGIFSAVALDGSVRWTAQLGGRIESTACLVGDLVCVGCYDGRVYFLSAESGTLFWTFETGDLVKCSPCPVGDDVAIGSHDHFFYRLSPNSKSVVWKLDLGAGIFARPGCIVDGDGQRIIVGTLGGFVFAIDASSGAKLWSVDMGKPIFAAPAFRSGGGVYVGTVGGTLSALDAAGSMLWNYSAGAPIFSTPVVHSPSGTIVFGSHAKRITALSPGGREVWSFSTYSQVYASVSILGKTVFAADTDAHVFLLDIEDGSVQDFFVGCSAEVYSSPVPLDAATIVLAGRDDRLHLFHRAATNSTDPPRFQAPGST